MTKYKIIQNQIIIAVLEGLIYVKQQSNGLVVPCGANKNPNGILSDEGAVWHLEGLPAFATGSYDTIKAVEITDAEYEELKAALAVDEEIEEPEPPTEEPKGNDANDKSTDSADETGSSDETAKPTEQVMSAAVMRQKITNLETAVAELKSSGAYGVGDEATQAFMTKLASPGTNSIAKIRAIAEQYLEDTAANIQQSEEVITNDGSGNC